MNLDSNLLTFMNFVALIYEVKSNFGKILLAATLHTCRHDNSLHHNPSNPDVRHRDH
jgi:hypothetical protein